MADLPSKKLTDFRPGMKAIPSRMLNDAVEAINRTMGVKTPAQTSRGRSLGKAKILPTMVNYLIEDSSIGLFGLQVIDGVQSREGDLVLRACDDDLDGAWYIVAGAWRRVGRFSSSQGNDNAPVYTKGTLITVFDGDSAPAGYVVCVDTSLSL